MLFARRDAAYATGLPWNGVVNNCMARHAIYYVFVMIAALTPSCALSQTVVSETPRFINWLLTEHLHSGKTIKLSRTKAFMNERDFRGWTVQDFYRDMTKDNPPGTFSFMCAVPVTYQSSSLQFLKEHVSNLDTAFLLSQIYSSASFKWANHLSDSDKKKVSYIPLVSDPSAYLPLPFSILTAPIKLFAPKNILGISQPIFTSDFKYVVVKIQNRQWRRRQGTILIFRSESDQWTLVKTINESKIAQ